MEDLDSLSIGELEALLRIKTLEQTERNKSRGTGLTFILTETAADCYLLLDIRAIQHKLQDKKEKSEMSTT